MSSGGLVYKITNLINNKVYIGQTKGTLAVRWRKHCSPARNRPIPLISKSILKYGKDNFKIEEIDKSDTINELNNKEKYWILELQSMVPTGYNLKEGGLGSVLSDISIQKISKKLSGRKRTKEECLAISKGRIGIKCKPMSEETKLKISVGNKGKTFSKESREKMSKSHKNKIVSEATKLKFSATRRNAARKILCTTTQEIFNSAADVKDKYGIDNSWVIKICKGKQKTAKGLVFKYYEKEELNE